MFFYVQCFSFIAKRFHMIYVIFLETKRNDAEF